jgi:ethanolaminephosphotransferase
LKLFPNEFDLELSDPTHSFFAQDTVEVDNNVTRHIAEFLDPTGVHPKSRSWDALVMHYLGLDHAGHMRGPRSSLMKAKQAEMDRLVYRIVSAISAQDEAMETNTLLVLLSDHGMTESGNHGGASTVEKDAVLALFPPRQVVQMEKKIGKKYKNFPKKKVPRTAFEDAPRVRQLDLVPTVAVSLGLHIPIENQGALLSSFLTTFMDETKYMKSLNINVEQFRLSERNRMLLKDTSPQSNGAKLNEMYTTVQSTMASPQQHITAAENYLTLYASLLDASSLSSASSSSMFWSMVIGLLLLSLGTASLLLHLLREATTLLRAHKASSFSFRCVPEQPDEWFVSVAVPILNGLALISSSLIENEHAFWYIVITTWCFLRVIRLVRTTSDHSMPRFWCHLIPCLIVIVILRGMRSTTSIINFARLNGLDEPTFVSSTAVIMVSPIEDQIDMVRVLACVLLVACVSLWLVCQQTVNLLLKVLSALLVTVGCLAVSVRLCAKSETFDISPIMDQWSILICPTCALLLVFLSLVPERTTFTNYDNDHPLSCRGRTSPTSSMVLVSFIQVAMFLHRPERILSLAEMFVVVVAMRYVLLYDEHGTRDVYLPNVLIYVCLGQCCFFSLGNSHTMGTADFAGAYTGATTFGKHNTGFLACIMVFTGPLVAYFGALASMAGSLSFFTRDEDEDESESSGAAWMVLKILLAYRFSMMTVSSIVTYGFQHHLFVWSVFAPKFVYEVGQTSMLVLFICFVLVRHYSGLCLHSMVGKRLEVAVKKTV